MVPQSSEVRRASGWLKRQVSIDTRALAAFRIALASLVLADLLGRSRHLVAFYTDSGVLPRSVLQAAFPGYRLVSLHALSGTVWWQIALFALAGSAAVALLVGCRTRAATALSLVLLVSLQARNPLVLNAGDTLLRRLLFWGLLLPLGERWAVDTVGDEPRDVIAGLASAGLLLQVVAVYVQNAVFKFRADTWPSGRAVRLVFGLDQFTVLAGDLLATAPALLTAINWAWLVLLLCSPLLLVVTGRARALLVVAFAGAHLGMALTISIGLFPLVSVAALLPFLPPVVWDRVWPSSEPSLDWLANRLPGGPALPSIGSLDRLRRPLLATVLVVLLLSNAVTLGVVPVGQSTAPDKSWDMFAPTPPLTDGWFVAPATTASGETVDALHGGPVTWERPPDLASTYPSSRWRKYTMQLRGEDDEPLRRSLATFLCQRWTASHERDPVEIRLVFVAEPTQLGEPDPRERRPLGTYACGPKGQQSSVAGPSPGT